MYIYIFLSIDEYSPNHVNNDYSTKFVIYLQLYRYLLYKLYSIDIYPTKKHKLHFWISFKLMFAYLNIPIHFRNIRYTPCIFDTGENLKISFVLCNFVPPPLSWEGSYEEFVY